MKSMQDIFVYFIWYIKKEKNILHLFNYKFLEHGLQLLLITEM
jgi:hypothetical protein